MFPFMHADVYLGAAEQLSADPLELIHTVQLAAVPAVAHHHVLLVGNAGHLNTKKVTFEELCLGILTICTIQDSCHYYVSFLPHTGDGRCRAELRAGGYR